MTKKPLSVCNHSMFAINESFSFQDGGWKIYWPNIQLQLNKHYWAALSINFKMVETLPNEMVPNEQHRAILFNICKLI